MSESFSLGGVDLSSTAYDVRLLASVDGIPPRRGENVVVAGRVGRQARYMPVEQRVISLAMWVQGQATPAGAPTVASAGQVMSLLLALTYSGGQVLQAGTPAISVREDLQAKQETLQQILAQDGQQTLRHTLADASVRSIAVETSKDFFFRPQSHALAMFVVDFVAARPFWQAESLTTATISSIGSSPANLALTNAGSAEHRGATISIGGQITNPCVTIGSSWVQYTGTVNAGQTLSIDCGAFNASKAGSNVANAISHGGDIDWLMIPPGDSTAVLTGSSLSSASLTISFYPRYF